MRRVPFASFRAPHAPALAAAALAIAVIVSFAPALRAPELFDDPAVLDENPSLTRLLAFPGPLLPPAQSPVAGRPVANLTLAVDYAVNRIAGVDQRAGQPDPWRTFAFHLTNILLHLASGALLFGIVRRTLASGPWRERWQSWSVGLALAISGLWLLHPLQTEAVDYLAQRTELVVSLCFLGTLYASIRAWDASSGRARSGWFATGIIACLLGMASKEVMVTAPLMVLLYDVAFRRDAWRAADRAARRARRWYCAGLFATLLLLLALALPGPRSASAGWNVGLAWYRYLATQGWVVPRYLRLLLWPAGLLFDYGTAPVPTGQGVVGLALLALLAAGSVYAWTHGLSWRWLGFCGAWFFLLLAPSSSVISIATEVGAESRVYLASAAVIAALVVGVAVVARRLRIGSPLLTAVTVALLAALAVVTFQRSALYRSPAAIWRDSIAKLPRNARAWNNLGVVLIHAPAPDWTAADSLFRRAVALDRGYATAWFNLAASADRRHDESAAADDLRQVLAISPRDHQALAELGELLLARGDAAGALPYLERADDAAADPTELVDLGRASMATGHAAEAVLAFRKAISEDSSRIDAIDDLGGLLTEEGQPAAAVPLLTLAVRHDTRAGLPRAILSLADADLGRTTDAIRQAEASVTDVAGDLSVWFYAGRAMLVARQPKLADAYLERLVDAGVVNADAFAALGVAKAQLGQRGAAINWFRRALAIDPGNTVARTGLNRLAAPTGPTRAPPESRPRPGRHRLGAA